jgi:hypothetical protein
MVGANSTPKSMAESELNPQNHWRNRLSSWLRRMDASLRPVRLKDVSVYLAGEGSMLEIHYCTNRSVSIDRRVESYIIEKGTGKKLPARRIPYFGFLASHQRTRRGSMGYFIVDNLNAGLRPGIPVRVVVAGLYQAEVIIER